MAGPDDDSAASPPPRGSILRGIDFESIAEAIPHIVWLAGPDGLIEYVNSHAVDYAGVPQDALHSVWADIVHPDDLGTTRLTAQRSRGSMAPMTGEFRLRRHDGAYRWHQFRAGPLRNRDGDVIKWLGTATDIDKFKAACP